MYLHDLYTEKCASNLDNENVKNLAGNVPTYR